MASATFVDLVSLIPALAIAYVVTMGTVVLITGWKSFRDRTPSQHQRDVQVVPQNAPKQDYESAP